MMQQPPSTYPTPTPNAQNKLSLSTFRNSFHQATLEESQLEQNTLENFFLIQCYLKSSIQFGRRSLYLHRIGFQQSRKTSVECKELIVDVKNLTISDSDLGKIFKDIREHLKKHK